MLSDYKKWDKRYHYTYTITDFYNDYVEEFSDNVTRDQYKNLMETFFETLRNEIIENRYRFKMPFHLGTIRIKKRKNPSSLRKNCLDYNKTKKLGKKIYHLNLHTGRYYFRWIWEKGRGIGYKNKTIYSFRPLRKAKRQLAAYIKKCANDPTLKDYDCLP